jgi:transposase-like protein
LEGSLRSAADRRSRNYRRDVTPPTVFALPVAHRKRLRTTNLLERLNKEIKRRTRVATLFPNEASLLRLVSAVLIEISEDWETGKLYLNMQPH